MTALAPAEVALGSLYAFLVGAALGAFYDVFRVLRLLLGLRSTSKETPRARLVFVGEIGASRAKNGFFSIVFTALCDLVFFAAATAVYDVLVFHAAYGQNRWFLTLAALFGFLAYFFSIGRLVMRASGAIRFVLLALFAYLWFFASLPFKAAYKFAVKPASKKIAQIFAEKRTKNARKALAKDLLMVYNIDEV